jgi:hypothetical protein
MAESRDKIGEDRDLNPDEPTGMADENITGRANDEDADEFDETEDLDEEEEEEEESGR